MSEVRTARDLPQGQLGAREFAELLRANLNLVWLLALYLTGDPMQAELLAERCATRAWERRAMAAAGHSATIWLLTLVVGTWRQEFAALTDPSNWVAASVGDAYELTRAAGYGVGDDPAADLATSLSREEICRAFRRLPLEERAVTALSLAANLSYRELGVIVGAPREVVRERLQRGRAGLKLELWKLKQV